jgi:hypothetical protein
MTASPRVWFAIILTNNQDVVGAVRRSKRAHLKQDDARREVEGWVTEMRRAPVRWEIADDEMLVGRITGHFVIVSSLFAPQDE